MVTPSPGPKSALLTDFAFLLYREIYKILWTALIPIEFIATKQKYWILY